ncbi:lycopene cyclase family protein [Curtobacterium sp. RRHDQ10]|uniref:lycopene cyclase family protein n=1 Tax=Curtobacterium phyllosphaerae TaxID=3413379 RepID=UPI003BF11238
MLVADPTNTPPRSGAPTRSARRSAVLGPLPTSADVVIVGGGCAGLATALTIGETPGDHDVVVIEGRRDADTRSWCSWEDGSDPVPEARSASWIRWEVRTDRGSSVGSDPAHPYTLVRAADRRRAVERRLAERGAVRIVDGTPVRTVGPGPEGLRVVTACGTVDAPTVLDARGPRCPTAPTVGRVLLHQRFVGQWIRADRPVFDHRTVTLMDFTGQPDDGPVHFVYVLPVSPTEALVESTLFTPDGRDPLDHRDAIATYVGRRWGLPAGSWTVTEEERGCIPMTDLPPETDSDGWAGAAVQGTTRPSTGYGFARTNRHAVSVAAHLLAGSPVPAFTDRARTRFLDAVFLRFLRDRPGRAPEAFRRLMALPGPLVVRFLSERSSVLDDLRVVLALQKAPFLAALVRTGLDAVARHRRDRRSRR